MGATSGGGGGQGRLCCSHTFGGASCVCPSLGGEGLPGIPGEKPHVTLEVLVAAWGGRSSWDGFLARAVSCWEQEHSSVWGRLLGVAPHCDTVPGAAFFPRQGDRFLEAFRAHASAQISARDQSLASQRELGTLLVDTIDQQVLSGWAHPAASHPGPWGAGRTSPLS